MDSGAGKSRTLSGTRTLSVIKVFSADVEKEKNFRLLCKTDYTISAYLCQRKSMNIDVLLPATGAAFVNK